LAAAERDHQQMRKLANRKGKFAIKTKKSRKTLVETYVSTGFSGVLMV